MKFGLFSANVVSHFLSLHAKKFVKLYVKISGKA